MRIPLETVKQLAVSTSELYWNLLSLFCRLQKVQPLLNTLQPKVVLVVPFSFSLYSLDVVFLDV